MTQLASSVPPNYQSELSRRIQERSIERWGTGKRTVLVGRHPALTEALERLVRFAAFETPVLITGETGTGKELFARGLYLLSRRARGPFLGVNCAQYQDTQLIASELFGHRRGSFTGAVSDHRGVFEEAEGGVVFLDEIGELSPAAQSMLLRALGENEIVAVGSARATPINVRVIAATSRDLLTLVERGAFRADLYYRLRHLHVRVPPVRERGADWQLILDYYLQGLNAAERTRKVFSSDALLTLTRYAWPGNVRELCGVVDMGFALSDGVEIAPADFAESLERVSRTEQLSRVPVSREPLSDLARLASGDGTFWETVYRPFMDRELSRADVRSLIDQGLATTRGSYKRLLKVFGIADEDYLRFMDFLRHHDLKPRATARVEMKAPDSEPMAAGPSPAPNVSDETERG